MAYTNVAEFLGRSADKNPLQAAIKVPSWNGERLCWESVNFGTLNDDMEAIIHYFGLSGINKGAKVLLMVKPGLPLIQICFALFKMGAVPVVIDPGMGLKAFLNCVRHTEPEALVGIPLGIWVARIFRKAFRSVRIKIQVGRSFKKRWSRYLGKSNPAVECCGDDLAAILFTSGSTGAPKGVCYQHRQFSAQLDMLKGAFGIEQGEVDLPLLPVFALFNPALGMTTIVPDMNPSKPASVDAGLLIRTLHEGKVTNSFGSPAIWSRVADHCERTGERMVSVRRLLMAGAPVAPKLFRRLRPFFPNAKLYSPYGATECLPVSFIESEMVLNETAELTESGKGTCVGFPVPGVLIKIIQIDEGESLEWSALVEMPLGEIGEILVTGPSVTERYYRLDEATIRAKVVDSEGRIWHRMGDAGYLDERGRLWFCGRVVERVVTNNQIYYTDCCEGIFLADEAVDRCALIGMSRGGRTVPAMVIEGEVLPKAEVLRLEKLAESNSVTRGIEEILFLKKFPVDVRHNAKIHRLTIAKKFSK